MIDHLSFGVAHVGRSRAFYDSTLGALGYKRLYSDDESIGYGATEPQLWLQYAARPVAPRSRLGDAPVVQGCFARRSRRVLPCRTRARRPGQRRAGQARTLRPRLLRSVRRRSRRVSTGSALRTRQRRLIQLAYQGQGPDSAPCGIGPLSSNHRYPAPDDRRRRSFDGIAGCAVIARRACAAVARRVLRHRGAPSGRPSGIPATA